MIDSLWTLTDVARYLKMNERTVAKLASAGVIPGTKIASQWRFKPSLIEEWLVQQIKNLSPEQIEQRSLNKSPMPISVAPLLTPDACVMDLNGTERDDALRALAEALGHSGRLTDVDDFLQAVLHREYLCSTGLGDGIAVPHPRHSSERFCEEPCVALGRSTNGLDYNALDGRPVKLIFLVGAPDDDTHLRILAQISRLFRDGELRQRLMQAESAAEAINSIAAREEVIGGVQIAS